MRKTLATLLVLSASYMLLNFFTIPRESIDAFINYGFIGAVGAILSAVLLLVKPSWGRWLLVVWAVGSLIFFGLDIQARVVRPFNGSMFMGAYWAGKFDVHTYVGVALVYIFNTLKFGLPLVSLIELKKLK